MIYTRMAGGLGNQLFQLAATIAFRGDTPTEVLLCSDGLQRYQVKRTFDLLQLLHLPNGYHNDIQSEMPGVLERSLMRLRIGRFLPVYGVNDRNFLRQLELNVGDKSRRKLWLDGYFQQNWPQPLFDSVLMKIQAMLRHDLPSSQQSCADCLIHIRGSDFLASKIHRVTDVNFYVSALAKLRELKPEITKVAIVTDDVKHASSIMEVMQRKQPDISLSLAEPSDKESVSHWLNDFELMRHARARIIGNSSFAWWATALDANCAVTVAPNQWVRGEPRDLFLSCEHLISI